MSEREPAFWVRASTDKQETSAQIENVNLHLKRLGVTVKPEYQFVVQGVGRSKVTQSEGFKRLIQLVEDGVVGTIYVESQDRIGGTRSAERTALIDKLQRHEVALFDLSEGCDLALDDIVTDFRNVLGTRTNRDKLQKAAQQGIRTKVSRLNGDLAWWPSGPQPFGFAKECWTSDGKTLQWMFVPTSKDLGVVHDADDNGDLHPRPKESRIPKRDDKSHRIRLVPHPHQQYVDTIKQVFDLYANARLSFAAVADRLNEQGLFYYSNPWTHSLVSDVLKNPAYAGDIAYGKTESGEHSRIGADGTPEAIPLAESIRRSENPRQHKRDQPAQYRKDAHKPLVERELFNRAQARLLEQPTTRKPRNPAYVFNNLLVCGFCGRGMRGITTKEGVIKYECSSRKDKRIPGEDRCKGQTISQQDAEDIMVAEVKRMGKDWDAMLSDRGGSTKEALAKLNTNSKADTRRYHQMIDDGIEAFCEFAGGEYAELDAKERRTLAWFYHLERQEISREDLPQIKKAIKEAEVLAAAAATARVKDLKAKRDRTAVSWAVAEEDIKPVVKRKLDKLRKEVADAERISIPVSQRLMDFYKEEAAKTTELQAILDSWPLQDLQNRAESLRRVFTSVKVFWEPEFHPAESNPPRTRKTKSTGRYSFRLLPDKTEFTSPLTVGSW